MNRKLHTIATTLTIASVGLVLVLMAGQSAMPSAPLASLTVTPEGAQGLRDATAFDSNSASDVATPASKARPSRRMRQTVAMPFFSFAPRG